MAHGFTGEADPPSATAVVELKPLSLFGMGLVEAIPEAEILSREDPDDADGDGISGRAGRDAEGRLGRFTGKAEWFRLSDFIESALITELGLTTPNNPVEETLNGVPIPPETDPMPEPEIDERGINILTDFVRFLAPPVRATLSAAALRDSVERGEQLFEDIGCTPCHTPSLRTGPSDISALDRKTANIYSDLLLHDMGAELAGACGLNADPSEHRTAKLWGLRFKDRYMFDGRATSLRQSVELHGGESEASRDAFQELSAEEQAYLLRFLSIL